MVNYTGTTKQQEMARIAIESVKFPFDKIPDFEIGWADLNARGLRLPVPHHSITGTDETERKYTLGVFFPSSGNIQVDIKLITNQRLVSSTISAEVAHAVDQGILTDKQRNELMLLLHHNKADKHTWWEKVNYSTEYWTLCGEAFMILFTKAYSDVPFGNPKDFVHSGKNVRGNQVRKIIGIERTDNKGAIKYVVYGKSKNYHLPTHYKKAGTPVTNVVGLKACKICIKN